MNSEIINTPEESQKEDQEYWIKKMSNISDYLLEQYKLQQEKNKYALKKTKKKIKDRKEYNIFEFAPLSVLTNHEIMLKALEEQFIHYHQVDKDLKTNKNFVIKYLTINKNSYYFVLDDESLLDDEIFNLCLKKDAKTYTQTQYHRVLANKYSHHDKILQLLDINPNIYEHLEDKFKNDLVISKKAINLDLKNVQFMRKTMSSRIFKEPILSAQLLEKNIDFFVKINDKLRDDEEFLIPFIQKKPSLIEFVSPRLKGKRDFIKHALGAWNLLDNISDEFKKDVELMQLHLYHCIHSHYELKKHLDVNPLLVNVLKKHSYYYKHLNEEMKLNEDYLYAVLFHPDFYDRVKEPNNYFSEYKKVNILYLLPPTLQSQLMSECQLTRPNIDLNSVEQTEKEEMILAYARKKYTDIYLEKNLIQRNPTKALKI